MSSSNPGATVELIVEVADAGTEVFVSDARFQLVGRGVGGYRGAHPPGIYQVRLRAACATRDDIVVLPVGQSAVTRSYPLLAFASPVPLTASTATPDLSQTATQHSQKVNKTVGQGASIFVFVRSAAGRTDHPAHGMSLVNARLRLLVDFAQEADRGPPSDPWAACTVAVDPGNYLLRLEAADGAVEQSLVVGPAWQVQVFVQAAAPQLDLCGTAILYARNRQFDPAHSETRLSELARIGLINRRQVISEAVLSDILAGKFENPMLGLFGAHLALERWPDRVGQVLPEVVRNLRRLLAPSHPDVEALALVLGGRTPGYQFDWPPMLRRSWGLVVRASARQAGLIRPGGLADQMAARIWGQEPWLKWREPLRNRAEAVSFSLPAEDEATEMYESALKGHLEALIVPKERRKGGRRAPEEKAAVPTAVAEEHLAQLIGALGLPRPHIEALLKKMGLSVTPGTSADPAPGGRGTPNQTKEDLPTEKGTAMSETGIPKVSDAVRTAFAPILKALDPVRQALASVKDVVTVRPGYRYPPTGKPVPAVVVAVTPGTTPVSAADLEHRFGVAVSVTEATVEEQVAAQQQAAAPVSFAVGPGGPMASAFEALLTGQDVTEFGPPKEGAYEPLDPPDLPLLDEPMKATICVSPEAGWGELETFLVGTQERLTVAMYQFTAPHIFEAVRKAVTPAARTFELVLHPRPEKPPRSGVKAHDLNEEADVLDPLAKAMKARFKMSWATLNSKANPEGLWASAYHIKVAVRDGDTTWLSSGNWQSSNQPDVHPFAAGPAKLPAGFQRKYNRDYHAIIESDKLASVYETYIKRDYDLTSAQGKPEAFAVPDVFVPEQEVEEAVPFAAPPQLFPPLRLNRRIKVQPLLTPDNYAENALKLIRSAQKSVWFQNQYINFRGTNEDFNEFRLLVMALKEKIDAGLDVRIICRDMMKEESVDVLVALGFPREVLRFQPACHNKTILVDGNVVLFGSHNWSNEGVKTNRDASLIFYDEEIAGYLAKVYEYDWDRLATAKPTPTRPRVARDGEPTPPGHRREPATAVLED